MGSGNSLHLVKWETIQKPLVNGGLGLKCMTDFNISLVAPNILKVLNKENIPWVNLVHQKYGNNPLRDGPRLGRTS